ncbi:hypothetical protein FQN53_006430 [Emmonsiellopsis sp. PD_33]|nr:hypothetical protein FQN53_006430 [Emmonsiellopsis sp. PD_33]
MSSFSSLSLPDIPNNARILAVCGITDVGDASSPVEDGWLVSDFYLFNHLLRGIGRKQAWFTSEDPVKLVNKYGLYMHGNPCKERVIVLDQDKLNSPDAPHDISIIARDQLLDQFLLHLETECTIARQEKQPVIVFILGHGEESTNSVEIGWSIFNQEAPLLTMDKFKRCIGPDVGVCTVMTSCYSGGWIINPSFKNATPAAGPGKESELWNASASIDRRCGSIYATAVTQALVREERFPDASDLIPEHQKSYHQFTNSVASKLLFEVDRFGSVHEISFAAKDDAWDMEWKRRMGTPLSDFRARYLSLKTTPVDALFFNALNRDPNMPRHSDQLKELENWTSFQELPNFLEYPFGEEFARSGLRGRFGSSRSLQRSLRPYANSYMASFPGRDSLANNGRLHRLANQCIQGKHLNSNQVMELYCGLDYRLSVINAATQHLKMINVEFLPCHQWNQDQWYMKHEGRKDTVNVIDRMLDGIFCKPCLPQGRPYSKPRRYIASALAVSGLSDVEIRDKIEEMKAFVGSMILAYTANVKTDHIVASRRTRLQQVLGRIIISPTSGLA